MKVKVRKAQPEDLEEVYNVIKLAFEAYRKMGYSETAIQSAIISKKEIQNRIKKEQMLVAEIDKQIVGTVTRIIEFETMHVRTLATHPKFQNLGAGTKLMEKVNKEAVEAGCYKIFLTSTPIMKSAIHVYEKVGFKREGILKKQFHGIDLIAFGKVLHN